MTPAHSKFPAILRNATVGLLVVALLCGLLLPIYSDEVGWRFQERAWLDGVDKLYGDQCGANTLARPPLFMMPVRAYSAFFNTHFADPLFVRLAGVGYALVWIWLLLRLVTRLAASAGEARKLATIGCGLMGLGVLPLLLVWSRPEQPILLALTSALLLATSDWTTKNPALATALPDTPVRTAWARSLAVAALGAIALSYHVKAVTIMPAFFACLFYASRGRPANAARLVAGGLLLVATGIGTRYWFVRLSCPDDLKVAAQHAHQSFGLLLHQSNGWLQLLFIAPQNLKLDRYTYLIAPAMKPMSHWLAYGLVTHDQQTAFRTTFYWLWAAALAASLGSLALTAWQAGKARRLPPHLVLALVVLSGPAVWCVSQVTRNVYEASFVLPVGMLGFLLALSAPHGSGRMKRATGWLAAALAGVMVVSIALVGAIYGPDLVASSRQGPRLPTHPYSVPVFGYPAAKRDIVGAARQCGLEPSRPASNLLIDDTTYFTFMAARLPQHQLGVLSRQWRGSITDPIAYLRGRGSYGMIVGCQWLPPELAARAHRQGEFCCLAPPGW